MENDVETKYLVDIFSTMPWGGQRFTRLKTGSVASAKEWIAFINKEGTVLDHAKDLKEKKFYTMGHLKGGVTIFHVSEGVVFQQAMAPCGPVFYSPLDEQQTAEAHDDIYCTRCGLPPSHHHRYGASSLSSCANRKTTVTWVGSLEITLTIRDTSLPDGYSREELVEMLRTIRKHEKIQGWKVPEPKDG